MSKPKISVILPVYNVEDYLPETLDCLLNQSMIDEIEVIMVDDGSTDESRHIIESYALDYENFHAYHKENEGQAIARNYALDLARGDYIHFLDSDDYIPPEAYEKLYGLAVENDSDMAICNVLRFARYNAWEDILFKNSFKGITETINTTTLNRTPSLIWDTITCNKLYKREFLLNNGIRYPDRRVRFEDLPVSLESYILSDSISITPEVLYYWRLRSDRTSTTQQEMDVANIKDRLEMLRLMHELMVKHDVSEKIAREEYLKWVSHDLKFFIKRFDYFPQDLHRELFEEIREVVKFIPDDIIESLNSYRKAIFRMIQNGDFDSFILLSPMENDLFKNPHIPEFLDDEYKGYFDFISAAKDEELIAEVAGVGHDESNLYIEFSGKLNYLQDDYEHEASAVLICDEKRHSLEIKGSQIIIPTDIIRNLNHSNIEVRYSFDDFEKSAILKNRRRRSVEFEDFHADLNTGTNSYLYIDIMEKTDSFIEIGSIAYEDGEFILSGTSDGRTDDVYVENVISFERIACPVKHSNGLTFSIRESDLKDAPVKKWEINSTDCPDSVRLTRPFEFFFRHNKIRFINSRNKILIENDICSPVDELGTYNDENRKMKSVISSLEKEKSELIGKNRELKEENDKLKKRISEFKSRKVVRLADKLKLS